MWGSMCDRVRPRLPLLAGGDLMGPDRRLVERHLRGCDHCRRLLDRHRALLDVLHVAGDAAPARYEAPSVWPALERQIRESRRPTLSLSWIEPRDLARAGSLLAACLFGAVAALSFQPMVKLLYQYEVKVKPDMLAIQKVPKPIPRRPAPPLRHASLTHRLPDPLPSELSAPPEDFARGPNPPDGRQGEPTH